MLREYERNLLGVDNFDRDSNSRLRFYYDHIRSKTALDGDIFEFGVFKGASLIAAALILKEIGSNKKVYGFDSFDGFPSYSEYDDLNAFYKFRGEVFSEEFLAERERFLSVKTMLTGIEDFDPVTIASSGAFESTSRESVFKKIEYFGLDNITLVEGDFKETVPNFFSDNQNVRISAANIDCDLYDGYKSVLSVVYDRLVPGGYANLDEYYSFKYPGAKIACDEFFKDSGIEPIRNKARVGEFERWYFTKS